MARITIDGVKFKFNPEKEKHRRFFRRMVRSFKSDLRSDLLVVSLKVRDVPKGISVKYEEWEEEDPWEDDPWWEW